MAGTVFVGFEIDSDEGSRDMKAKIKSLIRLIDAMQGDEKIEAINAVKVALHEISPFRSEPVDCVLWVKNSSVHANDYNPNSVAPPEMELLRVSISEDGYTQPIVTFVDGDNSREVVDGFHRNRVGRECADVRDRVHGYLPVVSIREKCEDKGSRIASTIRHNRARGKHAVGAMSDIVVELKRRNWSDDRISRELGMDRDEILRLCQITGLAELFTDQQFSQAWDVEGSVTPDDFQELSDDATTFAERDEFRTVNTSDENRVFHTYDKWECYAAGFYATHVDGVSRADGEQLFAEFLKDDAAFRQSLEHVVGTWKHSCEHYLTNGAMNRLAWLGQVACCHAKGIPSCYRAGWFRLTSEEQAKANATALEYLNQWLVANGREAVSEELAIPDRQSEIY